MNEYVFRHAGGCVIDFPDITVEHPPPWQPYRWIATVWPDQYRHDGWGVFEWRQGERGWVLPATLAVVGTPAEVAAENEYDVGSIQRHHLINP